MYVATCYAVCRGMGHQKRQCQGMKEGMPRHAGRDPKGRIEYAEAYKHVCHCMGPEVEKKIKSLILIRLLVCVGF